MFLEVLGGHDRGTAAPSDSVISPLLPELLGPPWLLGAQVGPTLYKNKTDTCIIYMYIYVALIAKL